MPYKDKVKAREYAKQAMKRKRNVIPDKDVIPVMPKKVVIPKPDVIPYDARTFGYATRDVPKPAWMRPGAEVKQVTPVTPTWLKKS